MQEQAAEARRQINVEITLSSIASLSSSVAAVTSHAAKNGSASALTHPFARSGDTALTVLRNVVAAFKVKGTALPDTGSDATRQSGSASTPSSALGMRILASHIGPLDGVTASLSVAKRSYAASVGSTV